MSFFDTTPLGRVTNRLSKDVYTVDEQIPGTIRGYLVTTMRVTITLLYVSSITPFFLLLLLPLATFYYLGTSPSIIYLSIYQSVSIYPSINLNRSVRVFVLTCKCECESYFSTLWMLVCIRLLMVIIIVFVFVMFCFVCVVLCCEDDDDFIYLSLLTLLVLFFLFFTSDL